MTKTREQILSALEQNLPPKEEIIVKSDDNTPEIGPSDADLVKASEEDFEISRGNVKKLLTTSDEAIGILLNLASDSEHPRAFEVLANMIKTASDVNKQLMDLSKDRKKLVRGDDKINKKGGPVGGTVTNNAIFVGTTSDLQKRLKENALKPILDVDEID